MPTVTIAQPQATVRIDRMPHAQVFTMCTSIEEKHERQPGDLGFNFVLVKKKPTNVVRLLIDYRLID